MVSKEFLKGMLLGAKDKLDELEWYQFIQKARILGFILAIELIVMEMKENDGLRSKRVSEAS